MGIADHFLDSVTVWRATTKNDPLGMPTASWDPWVTVPGRLTQKDRRVWDSASQQSLVVGDYLLLLPEGTDVTARDEVEVDGIRYKIEGLLERRAFSGHHLSLRVSLAE